MSEQQRTREPSAAGEKVDQLSDSVPVAKSDEVAGQNEGESAPGTKELTSEEQMALFEKELKESDWGHQPC